jgi:hypothetical protein
VDEPVGGGIDPVVGQMLGHPLKSGRLHFNADEIRGRFAQSLEGLEDASEPVTVARAELRHDQRSLVRSAQNGVQHENPLEVLVGGRRIHGRDRPGRIRVVLDSKLRVGTYPEEVVM